MRIEPDVEAILDKAVGGAEIGRKEALSRPALFGNGFLGSLAMGYAGC